VVRQNFKEAVRSFVEKRGEDFISISHYLYENPETGLKEQKAASLICNHLKSEGFAPEQNIAGMDTAFCAVYGTGSPCIALLAEMDALPELGHACGHNIIAAAAVGAAVALKNILPEDIARIKLIGTPAEELGIGKIELIKAGYFDDVDFAMMVHPSSRRYVTKGYLGLARIRFTFHGRPAHAAAYPEEGINALDGVIQTFNAINALRQQLRQDVRIHGIITEGGVAPNIIPARASCSFYVRAEELEQVHRVTERVVACANGAATATGCRLEIDADPRVLAPFKINRSFAELYSRQLQLLNLVEDDVAINRNNGSSDIGNVSQIVPTIHPHVPIGKGVNIHSSAFAKATVSPEGDSAVLEGAMTLAMTVVDLALSHETGKRITREFREI
jgi:amidohydrolase